MYAIAEIAGKQYKLQENFKLYVPRLQSEVDATITLDRILLVAGDNDIRVGTPVVDGVKATARVLRHVKGDKILVFKKKRRKGYRVKNGHRQQYTQILVEGLDLGDKKKAKS